MDSIHMYQDILYWGCIRDGLTGEQRYRSILHNLPVDVEQLGGGPADETGEEERIERTVIVIQF